MLKYNLSEDRFLAIRLDISRQLGWKIQKHARENVIFRLLPIFPILMAQKCIETRWCLGHQVNQLQITWNFFLHLFHELTRWKISSAEFEDIGANRSPYSVCLLWDFSVKVGKKYISQNASATKKSLAWLKSYLKETIDGPIYSTFKITMAPYIRMKKLIVLP